MQITNTNNPCFSTPTPPFSIPAFSRYVLPLAAVLVALRGGLAAPDGGVVAAAYAPNRLTTIVRGKEPVIIREEIDFSFRETVRFVVELLGKSAVPLKLSQLS